MINKLGIAMVGLFLFGGLLGLVPGVIKDGMYLGIFMVNPPHNILQIVSGIIFLIASLFGARPARLGFQIFGAFYGVLTVMGFMVGEGMIFGVISNNGYDAWGHAVLALTILLIGFATSKQTAAAFTAVLAARNAAKADAVKAEIKAATGDEIDIILADLSSLREVARLAETFKGRYPRLDVLINNAGIFMPKRMLTGDGFEASYQVNYLSHFFLTHLPLDELKKANREE